MERFEVRLARQVGPVGEDLMLQAPSLPIALIVADINLSGGIAEIWRSGHRLARLRKRHCESQAYWELW